jgi:hypothetical protein
MRFPPVQEPRGSTLGEGDDAFGPVRVGRRAGQTPNKEDFGFEGPGNTDWKLFAPGTACRGYRR